MAKLNQAFVDQRGGVCTYCRRDVWLMFGDQHHPSAASRDHEHPRGRGGTDANDNLVLACSCCNAVKGDMTGVEYREFLRTGELPKSYIAYIAKKKRDRFRSKGGSKRLTTFSGTAAPGSAAETPSPSPSAE